MEIRRVGLKQHLSSFPMIPCKLSSSSLTITAYMPESLRDTSACRVCPSVLQLDRKGTVRECEMAQKSPSAEQGAPLVSDKRVRARLSQRAGQHECCHT